MLYRSNLVARLSQQEYADQEQLERENGQLVARIFHRNMLNMATDFHLGKTLNQQ